MREVAKVGNRSGKSAKSGTHRIQDSGANKVHISSKRSSKMQTAGVDILQ